MYCGKCGNKIAAGMEYCPFCGAKTGTGGGGNVNDWERESFEYIYNTGQRSSDSKKIPIVIAIVCAAIVFGCLGFLAARQGILPFGNQYDDTESVYSESEEAGKSEKTESKEAEQNTDSGQTAANEKDSGETSASDNDYYYYDSEYIFAGSDSRYIKNSELAGMSADEIRLGLNELYARHGRRFNDDYLQSYFNSKSWYYPSVDPDDFSENVFNKYEKANKDLLAQWQIDHGYR